MGAITEASPSVSTMWPVMGAVDVVSIVTMLVMSMWSPMSFNMKFTHVSVFSRLVYTFAFTT